MKITKGIIVIIVSCLGFATNLGAQDFNYTQYYLNLPAVNPGFTGMEDFWDLKLSFRQQGVNNFDARNKSLYISTYGPVNSSASSSMKNNSLRLSDPNSYNNLESNRGTRKKLLRRHGIGGMLFNRDLGAYQSFNASFNYAYHLPVSRTHHLSFGTSIRYSGRQIGISGLMVRDVVNDQTYQQLVQSGKGRMDMMIVDFGTALYSDKGYVGLSSTSLISYALGISDFNSTDIRTYSLQAGRFMRLGANLELSPVINVDYNAATGVSGGGSARLRYRSMVYAGAGYQSNGKASGMLGFTMSGKYNLNYSYDHYFGPLQGFNVTMHEVVFGITLFNKYGLNSSIW